MVLLAAIVNYQSSAYLDSCLRSLAEAGVERATVVDNYSSLAEREQVIRVAEGAALPVTVVISDTNPGFGASVNLAFEALEAADTDLVWVVNPDATVTSGAAISLSACILEHGVDIVSPLIVTGDVSSPSVWFGGGVLDTRSGRTLHSHMGEDPLRLSGLQDVSFVTGAAPMLTARTFRQLGGFREDLFLYWEDADLSRRATEARMRLAVDLDSKVWHAVGGSGESAGRSPTYYRYMQRNRLIVCSQWTPRWSLMIGPGSIETAKLLLRPLKESSGPLAKFRAGASGMFGGFRASSKHPIYP